MPTANAPPPAADRFRKAPRAALTFDRVPFQLAAQEGDGLKRAPFSMLARSGDPIFHWYWGQCIHDMAGFSAPPKVTVDYCHDPGEVLGLANKFKASDAGLELAGEVISTRPGDRAEEVVTLSQAGVPYQASISFDIESLEELMPGAKATVNGRELTGPAIIFREWSLYGQAVCPYGADKNTSTQFSGRLAGDVDLSHLFKENAMSKAAQPEQAAGAGGTQLSEATPKGGTPAAAAAELSETTPPANNPSPGASRTEFAAELKKFTDKFGAANGAKWFTEGKSYAEALELHAAELSTQLAASKTENGELAKRLTQAKPGEASPATFADGEGKPGSKAPESKLAQQIGPNLARFAAGIKLPGAK